MSYPGHSSGRSYQFKCKNSKLSKPWFSSIWPIDRTLIRCYHSKSEWTWKQWRWRDTPHSLELQHYWNLTIKLFSVISRTHVVRWGGGLTPLQKSSRCILQPQLTEQYCKVKYSSSLSICVKLLCLYVCLPIWVLHKIVLPKQLLLSASNNFLISLL